MCWDFYWVRRLCRPASYIRGLRGKCQKVVFQGSDILETALVWETGKRSESSLTPKSSGLGNLRRNCVKKSSVKILIAFLEAYEGIISLKIVFGGFHGHFGSSPSYIYIG